MPITVACNCGKKFQAKDELAGKRVKCPGCGEPIGIPAAGSSPAAQAAPKPAAKPAAPAGASGARPAAKAPAQAPLDPLGGLDPLGDLGALESAANALNAPAGFGPMSGDPLGGAMAGGAMGNPLMGNNPLMGGPMMGGMNAYQQPAPRKSGNPVLWVGIGGGVLALLIVVGIVAAVMSRDTPPEVASSGNKNTSNTSSNTSAANTSTSSPSTATQPNASAQKPVEAPAETTAPSAALPSSTGESTAATLPAGPSLAGPPQTAVPAETTSPDGSEPDEGATTSRNSGRPRISASDKQWKDLGPAIHTRLGKPDILKGANVVGKEPVILAGYSWMTELLPYIGEEERYKKFDFTKSWTVQQNANLTYPVAAFLNPADNRKEWQGWPYKGMGLTHFVGMSGIEDTRNDVAALLPRSDPRAGIFGYDTVARPTEVTDGTSNTIMLIGSGNLAAPWVQGGGATIRGLREPYFDEMTGFGSKGLTEPGALVMMADGSVKTLSAKISPKVLRALCTMHGAETVDQAELESSLK